MTTIQIRDKENVTSYCEEWLKVENGLNPEPCANELDTG